MFSHQGNGGGDLSERLLSNPSEGSNHDELPSFRFGTSPTDTSEGDINLPPRTPPAGRRVSVGLPGETVRHVHEFDVTAPQPQGGRRYMGTVIPRASPDEESPRVAALREWLGHLADLYLESFVEEGYDALEVLRAVQGDEAIQRLLDDVGVRVPGHLVFLARQLRDLNASSTPPPVSPSDVGRSTHLFPTDGPSKAVKREWRRSTSFRIPRTARAHFGPTTRIFGTRFSNVRNLFGLSRFSPPPSASRVQVGFLRIKYHFFKYVRYMVLLIGEIGFPDLLQVALVTTLTYVVATKGYSSSMNPSLFLSVVVFPLAFAVQTSFSRREMALADLANMKSAVLCLFFMYRDWSLNYRGPDLDNMRELFCTFLDTAMFYMTCHVDSEKEDALSEALSCLNAMSTLIETFHHAGVPAPLLTRGYQLVKDVSCSFERMRVIADYRTPIAIRAFIKMSVLAVTVVLAPYFAYLLSGDRDDEHWNPFGYVAAVATPLLFNCLENTQRMLEEPFGNHQDSINVYFVTTEFEDAARGRPMGMGAEIHTRPTHGSRRRRSSMWGL